MEVRSEVERSLSELQARTTFGLCFIVVFCVAVTSILVWFGMAQGRQAARLTEVAVQTHNSLCALKNDIRGRKDRAVAYLGENPRGLVSPRTGEVLITAALLRDSIDKQEATLSSLSALDCPEEPNG